MTNTVRERERERERAIEREIEIEGFIETWIERVDWYAAGCGMVVVWYISRRVVP